jgi:hypothetical protein
MFVYRKSEGTGVFLPRFNKPFSKGSGVLPRGTGVFLNHQVTDKDRYGKLRNLFSFTKIIRILAVFRFLFYFNLFLAGTFLFWAYLVITLFVV